MNPSKPSFSPILSSTHGLGWDPRGGLCARPMIRSRTPTTCLRAKQSEFGEMHTDEPDLPLGRVMTPVSPAPWPCTISSPSLSCLPFPLRFLFPFHFHLLTCPYHPPPSNLSYPSSTSPPHLSLLASLSSLLPPSSQPPPISRCLARSVPKSPSG